MIAAASITVPMYVTRIGPFTTVNLNSTGDLVTFTGLPSKYIVDRLVICDWSTTPALGLTMALRDAASGAGNSLAGTITGLNTVITATALGLVAVPSVLAAGASRVLTSSSLYLNVSVANGSGLTATAYLYIRSLT